MHPANRPEMSHDRGAVGAGIYISPGPGRQSTVAATDAIRIQVEQIQVLLVRDRVRDRASTH
jgi:hypothetical protein